MGRGYSKKTVERLKAEDQTKTGIRLAAICVDARFSSTEVAKVFGVSRMTLFNWSKGKAMHPLRESMVLKFIERVATDFEKGILPMVDKEDRVAYLSNLRVE